ncbi:hypothetical protein AGMMS49525_12510 [Bacteroidia bacterium]|nr:hypothetical protein AGMMS49525_12510 [Bacteroidia bacterium]
MHVLSRWTVKTGYDSLKNHSPSQKSQFKTATLQSTYASDVYVKEGIFIDARIRWKVTYRVSELCEPRGIHAAESVPERYIAPIHIHPLDESPRHRVTAIPQ